MFRRTNTYSPVQCRRMSFGSFSLVRPFVAARRPFKMVLEAWLPSRESNAMPNTALERTAGSLALAAAAQRER